ncbi:nuclease-related domain-containing protein [Candidatus Altiarchaeota archaeon]
MKIVQRRRESLYVWRHVHLNLSRAIIFVLLFVFAIALFIQGEYLTSSVGLVLIPIAYALGLLSLQKKSIWQTGSMGEEDVLSHLEKLDDNYNVINGLVVPPNRGDTDHIILGPNGIFVIETKNYAGVIHCDGDDWTREKIGRGGTPYPLEIGSPSNQVKRNAKVLKDFVLEHQSEIFKEREAPHLWVNSIVVFTRKDVILDLKNSTVSIVEVEDLADYIESQESEYELSKEEVKRMGYTILKHSS